MEPVLRKRSQYSVTKTDNVGPPNQSKTHLPSGSRAANQDSNTTATVAVAISETADRPNLATDASQFPDVGAKNLPSDHRRRTRMVPAKIGIE
jgi:hypothetical protein